MKFERAAGILLHPTSLPSDFGIGGLGKEAYDFVDFLVLSKQKLWQILPLGPTGYADSPYQSFSSFAGNDLLINLQKLKEQELLSESDILLTEKFDDSKVNYGAVIKFKRNLFKKAFENFNNSNNKLVKAKFESFCEKNVSWLNDFSLFMSLKDHFDGKPWTEWDTDIKSRDLAAIKKYKEKLSEKISFYKFLQHKFFEQWFELKAYANINNVKIIGDIPIFVALDSCDAWANSSIFHFDEEKHPLKIAGVPPDYFSATGQLWGNPLYNWEKLKETNYEWWIQRVSANMSLVDFIRIDHFRGFAEYWAIPYGSKDAINGKWEKVPGESLFSAIKEVLGELPIIAEDLGFVTPDVELLRDTFDFPGMKIIQFGFDSKEGSPYIPHLFPINCVAYTGTHDNDTIVGWYEKASKHDQEFVKRYMNTNAKNIAWDFIRLAHASTAIFSIIPLQDILGLGSSARMNIPGTTSGNWLWRFKKQDLTEVITDKLAELSYLYSR